MAALAASQRLLFSNWELAVTSSVRQLHSSHRREKNHKCRLAVLGGGAGGSAVANKFAKHFGDNEVVVVEPSEV